MMKNSPCTFDSHKWNNIFFVFFKIFFQDFGGQREARDLRPGHNGAIHRQRGPRREDQDMVR